MQQPIRDVSSLIHLASVSTMETGVSCFEKTNYTR